jgi:hypothetical protein
MLFVGAPIGGKIGTRTFLQSETPFNTSATIYTFPAVNYGPEASDRVIVHIISAYVAVSTRTLNSVTSGGGAASIHINQRAPNAVAVAITAICSRLIPTGTSGDVVCTFSGNMLVVHCHTYALRRLRNNSPTAVEGTSNIASATLLSDTIDVPSHAILIAGNVTAASAGSFTWPTGVLLDSNATINNIPSSCASDQKLPAEVGYGYSAQLDSTTTITAMAAAAWH